MKRLNMVMNGRIIGHVDQDDRRKVTLTAPSIEGVPRLLSLIEENDASVETNALVHLRL
ncbi:MAG: hypothetical protein Q4C87_08120 [Actinomycetaceae bacterium]|nr:hypothetical protein [Actinomycetaceae bacterium]